MPPKGKKRSAEATNTRNKKQKKQILSDSDESDEDDPGPSKLAGKTNTKTTPRRPPGDPVGNILTRRGKAAAKSTENENHPPVPRFPKDAAAINIENHLDRIPMDAGRDITRPWYYFDLVEPVAKFRLMGDNIPATGTTDVPAGDGPLQDDPEDGAMPVEVIQYA